jgi:uncharacterized protein with PhoU and TrkA domain
VDTPTDETGVMEAAVTENSLLVGQTASQVRRDERHGAHLLAVSRSGNRITQRMRAVIYKLAT